MARWLIIVLTNVKETDSTALFAFNILINLGLSGFYG